MQRENIKVCGFGGRFKCTAGRRWRAFTPTPAVRALIQPPEDPPGIFEVESALGKSVLALLRAVRDPRQVRV